MKDCGVLYFLTAKEEDSDKVLDTHYDLLIRSVKSLKKLMSDIPTVLYTNIDGVSWEGKGFDIVNYKYGPDDIWTYKYECLIDSPFLELFIWIVILMCVGNSMRCFVCWMR